MRYTLTREYELDIVYEMSGRHVKASMDGPDEQPEVDVLAVAHNGRPFGVTREEMSDIEQKCYTESESERRS